MNDEDKLLNITEVSKRLGHSERTIRKWIKMGMPASRPGRAYFFDWAEVREWIKEQKGESNNDDSR